MQTNKENNETHESIIHLIFIANDALFKCKETMSMASLSSLHITLDSVQKKVKPAKDDSAH